MLKPALKAGPGLNRVVPPAETLRRVRAFAARCGVTRLADITGLDRVGIPVYSAVVPRSDDFLSVYNGKGSTRRDAQAGALMEAIERQLALKARPAVVTGCAAELRRSHSILEPGSMCHALREGYTDETPIDWVRGCDLFTGEAVMAPAKLAGYLWSHLPLASPFQHYGSHGLASGNCREEAVAHALCEWIERDAWTLADLKSHWLPSARAEAAGTLRAGEAVWDDLESYPCVSFEGIGGPVERMLKRFAAAGLNPIVRDITSDLRIPTVLAAVAQDDVPGFPQAHFGLGTHPDFRVAAARALSELAQSRCVDIQSVREDIAQVDGTASGVVLHTRRVASIERRSWNHARSRAVRDWRAVESHWNADVLDDIRLMLARMAEAGIQQTAMVDFSVPEEGIFVVRVLVPGLECWAVDHGRIGPRALRFWKANAA